MPMPGLFEAPLQSGGDAEGRYDHLASSVR
jgi:hypothetical protein